MARKPKKHVSVVLGKIRGLVRSGRYDLTIHVLEKIQEGEFDLDDLEYSVINGNISKNQNDELKQSKDGRKYVILGPTPIGMSFESVGKIMEADDGEEYIFITAYRRI